VHDRFPDFRSPDFGSIIGFTILKERQFFEQPPICGRVSTAVELLRDGLWLAVVSSRIKVEPQDGSGKCRRRCKYPKTLLCIGSGGMTARSTSTHTGQRVRSVYQVLVGSIPNEPDKQRDRAVGSVKAHALARPAVPALSPAPPPSCHPGDIAITQHSIIRRSFPVPCRAVLCCAVHMYQFHQVIKQNIIAPSFYSYSQAVVPRACSPYPRYCSYVHAILASGRA
jgi:hypothetical protein